MEQFIKVIWKKFRGLFTKTGFFICIYLVGWVLNGYLKMNFDLGAITNLYMLVIVKDTTFHGINSFLNSPRGQMPAQQTRKEDEK